jgi:hypothetical protein
LILKTLAISKIFRRALIEKSRATTIGIGIDRTIRVLSPVDFVVFLNLVLDDVIREVDHQRHENGMNEKVVHLLNHNIFLSTDSKMTRAILIHTTLGKLEEIELDITPEKNEIYNLLGGKATFIGQWPEFDVVIIKGINGIEPNENRLPPPFDEESVLGPILLVRMDEQSEPQDLTLREYRILRRGGYERVAV